MHAEIMIYYFAPEVHFAELDNNNIYLLMFSMVVALLISKLRRNMNIWCVLAAIDSNLDWADSVNKITFQKVLY